MSEAHVRSRGPARSGWFMIAGGAAILALLMGAFFAPNRAFPALLAATMFALGLPLGATALLDVHRLTGGAWGRSLRPTLVLCARTLPVFILPLLLLALGLRSIYPWTHQGAHVRPEIRAIWLSPPIFLARGLVYFIVWVILSRAAMRERRSLLGAALGLFFYAVTVSLASADWAMSLRPGYASSVYGALVAIEQIAAALGFAAAVGACRASAKMNSDLAQLLLAAVLGVAYIAFMQFLVVWSGNLPSRIDHFVARSDATALITMTLAGFAGLILPFVVLVDKRRRADSSWTARAGAGVLTALALIWLWRVGIAARPLALAWGGVALVAVFSPWLGYALPRTRAGSPPPREEGARAFVGAPITNPVVRLRVASPMSEDENETTEPRTEPPSVSIKSIAAVAAGFVATVALTLGAVFLAFTIENRPFADEWRAPLPHYPAPRLQVAPGKDLARLQKRQTRVLSGAGAGQAISRAMSEVAARGAQAYAPWTNGSSSRKPGLEGGQ